MSAYRMLKVAPAGYAKTTAYRTLPRGAHHTNARGSRIVAAVTRSVRSMEESGTGTRNDAMQPTTKKTMAPTPNCHGTQSGLRMTVGKSSMKPMTTAKSDTVTKLAPGSTMAVRSEERR